ncbi:histidine kinase [Myxococcus sp. K15C18031901]|uniref:sensor histidine kinase n=1 Tax=Myxococcus dinghuensis TaxID=2906761 RepID=UPI0020A6F0B3|nr:sensor histidine kinase [Myxococcus dinghuensis]MCP3098827.1 histidine kinase [Myxococcus dinghuensis]
MSRGLLACILLLGVSRPASATPRATTLHDFHHTAWTQKDGAPAGIWAMAQTLDGWLWLGTASGLYRFDGVSFERHDLLPPDSLASRSISVLLASSSGDLWVSYSFGGTSVRRATGAVEHQLPGGLPLGAPVQDFTEDGAGRIWASTPQGLYFHEQGAWHEAAPRWGIPPGPWNDLTRDGEGRLWLVGEAGTFLLERDARGFARVEPGLEPDATMWLAQDGRLWITSSRGPMRPLVHPLQPEPPRSPRLGSDRGWASNTQVLDQRGNAWRVGCATGGVCRLPLPPDARPALAPQDGTDRFTARDGLSTDSAMSLLEDREGNVWVGTQLGLDRFRANDVTTVHFDEAVSYFALVSDASGAVWSGSATQMPGVDHWWRMDASSPQEVPGLEEDITATFLDRDGALLLAGSQGFWRFTEGRFEKQPRPPEEENQRVQAIVRDRAGRLWMSFRASTVYRLDGETWVRKGHLAALPDLPPARAVNDDQGRLWFGYTSNQVAILEGDHVRLFSEPEGLRTGTVTAILPGKTPLVGGALGLAAFDGERFRPLTASRPEVLRGITGLVRTRDGTLWLHGHAGGVRIDTRSLERALVEPGYAMPFELFDMNDGMPGGAQQVRPMPSLVEGGDGRLWFASTNGLGVIDPATLHRNPVAPPVELRALIAGEQVHPPTGTVQLPPRTRDLRITYSALALGMPERVSFRYRLLGLDDGWQDPGARREAIYTNLGPGTYRFEVIAANEDGVWNMEGASLSFEIAPTFVQSRGFVVLCGVVALLALWCLYVLRMWQVTRRLRMRLEERHGERERIARELHDTLLQDIQALVLHVHLAMSRLSAGSVRDDLQRALDRADDTLAQGRDRVATLRAANDSQLDLPLALQTLGMELSENGGPDFRFGLQGAVGAVDPLVADELYHLGREALSNAYAHSRARLVEVNLVFGDRSLLLEVRDDGQGIDAEVLHKGGRAGHWGLRGMRERAQKLEGHFDLRSDPGQGTVITVTVSARRAYLRNARGWRRLFQRPGPGRQGGGPHVA